ncbi:MAG: cytochrome c oxidase assembly protein [Firmicutes bacterium]|nr:cytochrome c oxidase assembly protein [Bacillota bacterium]
MTLGESVVLWLCRPNLNVPAAPSGAFRLHPDVLAGVLILAGLYFAAAGTLRARGIQPTRRQRVYLALVFVILLVAEVSPLHDLSEGYLFSAHMVQHLLLILLLPPLLLCALPAQLFEPILRRPWAFKAAKVLTHPLVAIVAGNAVYTLWHLPMAYQSALVWHELHIVEHVLMMGGAILMWWPIYPPVKELASLNPPAKALYLFAINLAQLGVFAYVTFSNKVIYPFYASAPRLFGISPDVDQTLAGVIMKVGMAVVLIPVLAAIFFRWAKEEERAPDLAARP